MAINDNNKDTADQVSTAIFITIPKRINSNRQLINSAVASASEAVANLQAIETEFAAELGAIVPGSYKEQEWGELRAARDKLVSDAQAYLTALNAVVV